MEFGDYVREGSFEEFFVVGGSVEEYSVWGVLSLMVLVVVVWSVGGGSVWGVLTLMVLVEAVWSVGGDSVEEYSV